ncbi:hypothetical protein [Staphylococcus aureus]|uniref:hypothetical protein n=1 Tax=Staphylococcus aureus TaxID=1280 RepID=UPI0010C284BD|nr:hypothetical protein [Staphylococcus aureus]QBS01384.1 Transposase [Staphylococcus aureus]
MSIKPKVDIDVLLYMFQEYEKGVSFQYLIDTLQLDINLKCSQTIHDFILFFNHERITLKMADSV